jgi:hypothetical protein
LVDGCNAFVSFSKHTMFSFGWYQNGVMLEGFEMGCKLKGDLLE